MFIFITAFFISWISVDFIGYWLHRWSHIESSPLYKRHMTHHIKNYPARNFISKNYRSSGSDSLAVWFAPFLVIYCSFFFIILPDSLALMISLGAIPPAFLSTAIHDLTHLKGSFIWRHKKLEHLAVGHYAHHRNMRKNFGITSFFWDRIFKTYWKSLKLPSSL